MAKLALLISLIALVLALVAFQRTGGIHDLDEQIRSLRKAGEVARQETADALSRLERAVRPPEGQ